MKSGGVVYGDGALFYQYLTAGFRQSWYIWWVPAADLYRCSFCFILGGFIVPQPPYPGIRGGIDRCLPPPSAPLWGSTLIIFSAFVPPRCSHFRNLLLLSLADPLRRAITLQESENATNLVVGSLYGSIEIQISGTTMSYEQFPQSDEILFDQLIPDVPLGATPGVPTVSHATQFPAHRAIPPHVFLRGAQRTLSIGFDVARTPTAPSPFARSIGVFIAFAALSPRWGFDSRAPTSD